jgi:hypothetical protein
MHLLARNLWYVYVLLVLQVSNNDNAACDPLTHTMHLEKMMLLTRHPSWTLVLAYSSRNLFPPLEMGMACAASSPMLATFLMAVLCVMVWLMPAKMMHKHVMTYFTIGVEQLFVLCDNVRNCLYNRDETVRYISFGQIQSVLLMLPLEHMGRMG